MDSNNGLFFCVCQEFFQELLPPKGQDFFTKYPLKQAKRAFVQYSTSGKFSCSYKHGKATS
jgi:hypothetical protein